MTREELWNRLERAGYFDWCRREELDSLKALYFDGFVAKFSPPEYIKVRELFWYPVQTSQYWSTIVEQRKRSIGEDGNEHFSESWGEEYVQERLDSLLQEDFQYVGLDVQKQLELLEFLGFENRKPTCVYLEAWVVNLLSWLKCQNRRPWDSSCFDENKFALSRKYFYRMIEESPLALQGKWLSVDESAIGFGGNFPRYFLQTLQDLMRMADKGKFSRRPDSNPEHRAQFLKDFREDLDNGMAPSLLLNIWAMTKRQ